MVTNKKKGLRLFLSGLFLLLLTGIIFIRWKSGGFRERDEKKVRDLDYTVVEPEEMPEDLLEQIEKKKETPFHFTWLDGENLYLVEGYGTQKTGGYSISVEECYLSTDSIYVSTRLTGPVKGETVKEKPSCPFIVIKMPARQEPVIFE